ALRTAGQGNLQTTIKEPYLRGEEAGVRILKRSRALADALERREIIVLVIEIVFPFELISAGHADPGSKLRRCAQARRVDRAIVFAVIERRRLKTNSHRAVFID